MNFNQKYILTIYGPDLYGPVRNAFDEGKSITGASWRGLGRWKSRLFWALWNGMEPLGEWHSGTKKFSIFRAWSIEIFTSIFHFNRKQNKSDKFCLFCFFSHLIFCSNQKQIKVINFASFSLRLALKGVWHEIYAFRFLHKSASLGPLSIPLGPFRIFSKIRGDIRERMFNSDVNDTGTLHLKIKVLLIFHF
jgi:hypothetical protein